MNRTPSPRRSPFFQRIALLAGAIATTVSLHAHPGHPVLQHGPLHTVTSPFHLATLALFGIALVVAAHQIRQRIPRQAVQYAGAIALVSSVVLWGLRY